MRNYVLIVGRKKIKRIIQIESERFITITIEAHFRYLPLIGFVTFNSCVLRVYILFYSDKSLKAFRSC